MVPVDQRHMYIASDRPKNDTLVMLRPQDRVSMQEMSMQSSNSQDHLIVSGQSHEKSQRTQTIGPETAYLGPKVSQTYGNSPTGF